MALPQRSVEEDFYTEEEYLAREVDALTKSEYVRGQIHAMSGGTDDHATIAMSVGSALLAALRERGCRVMSSDMKVRTAQGVMRYPDVSVVCGPREYNGRGKRVITNPVLVVEMLSDSPEKTDRGEKLLEYQTMPSLTDYMIVSQHELLVQHYARAEAGHWDYQAVQSIDATFNVPSLNITLALADIYDQIEFGEATEDD
jgi:Uma2 family endonuclease